MNFEQSKYTLYIIGIIVLHVAQVLVQVRVNFNVLYLQVALADVDDHFLEGVDIDSLQLVVAGLLEHTGGD